jgi:catechol 2,3-dioxygenase
MSHPSTPSFDIAHLAHVETYTDHFEESIDFFTRVYGVTLSGCDETRTYLHAWDDYEFHTLKLARHHTTGIGHVAYRASSPGSPSSVQRLPAERVRLRG